jgi:hypothetical protein
VAALDERSVVAAPGRLWLSLGYEGSNLSAEIPWQSAARLAASWLFTPRWYAGAATSLYGESTLRSPDATLDVRRHGFELFAGHDSGGSALGWIAEAGPVVDLLVTTRVDAAPGFAPEENRGHWGGGFGARLGLRWRVIGNGTLLALAGVDALPWRVRYVVRAGQPEEITQTAALRGRFLLALTVPAW